MPLHGNWRNIFVALSEKKAILTSIKSNPFAKTIEDQVSEAENAIEALTRLAQAINILSR